MGLLPKIELTAQTPLGVSIRDSTGVYNVSTNPGGFGAPNPLTTDIQNVILLANRWLEAVAYTDNSSLSALQTGFTKTATFIDGVWKYKALYQVIPGGSAPAVTWTVGTSYIALANADTILAAPEITAVMITSLGTELVLYIDRSKPITNQGFYVLSPLAGTGTGNLWVGYEATLHFLSTVAVEDCLLSKLGKDALKKFPEGCNCTSEIMDMHNRLIAARIFFTNGNYPAAHEMVKELYEYCTLNCCC